MIIEDEGPLTDEEWEHIAMKVFENPNTARSFLVQRLVARIRALEAPHRVR